MEYPKMLYKGGIASTGIVVASAEEEAKLEGYSTNLLAYDVEPQPETAQAEVEQPAAPAPARRGRKPKVS